MEINGTIVAVLPLESGVGKSSGKEWKKQIAVLETAGQYPKKMAFEMWGDKIKELKVGDTVNVGFDVESREFNGRYYTEVKAWKVEVGVNVPSAPKDDLPLTPSENVPNDDLPF